MGFEASITVSSIIDSTLVIVDTVFEANECWNGARLRVHDSSVEVQRCSFRGNG